jgi:hypothetical protein
MEDRALLAFDPIIPSFQYSNLPIDTRAGFFKKIGNAPINFS